VAFNSTICSQIQTTRNALFALLCLTTLSPAVDAFGATPYHVDINKELWISGTSAGLLLGGQVLSTQRDAPSLDELSTHQGHPALSWDRHYMGQWDPAARRRSDVILAASLLAPLPLMANREHLFALGVMYGEVLLTTNGLLNVVKNAHTRYRPYSYNTQVSKTYRLDRDVRRSFFSGHAANITSNLVFSATVYNDLYPESAAIPWVWSSALAVAAYGSWQRVEAGWHFPTDVLVGMGWGALVGWGIPYLHKSRRGDVQITPFAFQDNIGLRFYKNW